MHTVHCKPEAMRSKALPAGYFRAKILGCIQIISAAQKVPKSTVAHIISVFDNMHSVCRELSLHTFYN